jgi:hypothetical protein
LNSLQNRNFDSNHYSYFFFVEFDSKRRFSKKNITTDILDRERKAAKYQCIGLPILFRVLDIRLLEYPCQFEARVNFFCRVGLLRLKNQNKAYSSILKFNIYYGLCESPSADGLGNSMTYLAGGGEHVISEGYVCEKICGTRE